MPAFGPMTPEVAEAWDFLAEWSYLPLSSRMGALSMGVLVALAVSDGRWRQKITRQLSNILVCSSEPRTGVVRLPGVCVSVLC